MKYFARLLIIKIIVIGFIIAFIFPCHNFGQSEQSICPEINSWWTGYVKSNYEKINDVICVGNPALAKPRRGYLVMSLESGSPCTSWYPGIPSNAIIQSIELCLYVYNPGGSQHNLEIRHLSCNPITAAGSTLWGDIADGDIYYDGSALADVDDQWVYIELNSLAVADLQEKVSSSSGCWSEGQWAIGLYEDGDDSNASYIYGYSSGDYRPGCIITYTIPCNPPTNLSATVTGQNTADLDWSTVSDAAEYEIRYKSTSNTEWTYRTTSYSYISISGLTCGTTYSWQVRNNCLCPTPWVYNSDWSIGTNFTTNSCSNVSEPNLTYNSNSNSLTVSGTTVSISLQVKNTGTGSAGSSTVGYYLSGNTTITTSDYLIDEDYVTSLSSGGSSSESTSKDVSTLSIPAGTYYVGYIIDYKNDVSESNEDDNKWYWTSPTVNIENQLLPNLTKKSDLENISINGTIVQISVGVINNGSGDAGSSYVGYYLSENTSFSTSSDYFVGDDYVSGLSSGSSSSENITVDVSTLSIPSGTYYVFYFIDYKNEVSESDEYDNRWYWPSPQLEIPPVSVKDYSINNEIIIYPNPTLDFINIECNIDNDWINTISIINTAGQTIFYADRLRAPLKT